MCEAWNFTRKQNIQRKIKEHRPMADSDMKKSYNTKAGYDKKTQPRLSSKLKETQMNELLFVKSSTAAVGRRSKKAKLIIFICC